MIAVGRTLTLATRNLRRQTRRTAVALTSVAFGIVGLMLASGFIDWIFLDMSEATIHSQLGHLQIVRPGYHELGRADPFRFLLPADRRVIEGIQSTPGVQIVSPRLYFAGLVSHEETTLSFVGEGIDPGPEAELSRSLTIVEGTPLRDQDSDGVLFGAGLARNLGVKIGDTVVLVATPASGGANAVEVTVRGTFNTITKAYDDATLRVTIDTARKLLRVRGAHAWMVLLDHTGETRAMTAALRERLPPREFEVVPWFDLADFYAKTVALFSRQVAFVKLIIAVTIVLAISNTMTMNVMERIGEIGTALALGDSRSSVLLLFLSEGAVLGVVGGIIGVSVGVALALLLSYIGIPMPPGPGMARGYVAAIHIAPALALQSLIIAIATTLIASAYPAWKASRLVIVDALRHNR